MAQVQVRRGRVEARLHAQRAAQLQAGLQVFGLEDFVGAAADQGKSFSVGQGNGSGQGRP
ncbi:hypothetical protein D9M69_716740 [compost metagenome]